MIVKLFLTLFTTIGIIACLIAIGVGLVALGNWLDRKYPTKQLSDEEREKQAKFNKRADTIAGFIGVGGFIVVIFIGLFKVMWG